jgi:hypothetical protein
MKWNEISWSKVFVWDCVWYNWYYIGSSCAIVGFWVVTAYAKGMYVVYELIIEEQYINRLNYDGSMWPKPFSVEAN